MSKLLFDLLPQRAVQNSLRPAFTFLSYKSEGDMSITYAELADAAKSYAAYLSRFAKPGDRVLLAFPSGLDFIKAYFGSIFAGLIAVPVPPPNPKRPSLRLAEIIKNAQPAVVLTTTPLLESLQAQCGLLDMKPHVISSDEIDLSVKEWEPVKADSNTIAMLQYTSGSTSTPKGVMLSHGNLMHNVSLIAENFTEKGRKDDVGMIWLPNYHDMGLIGGILAPLKIGCHTVLTSPTSFILNPLRWLEAISKYKVTISGAPNFAYELCVDKVDLEQAKELDLSSWKVAFCGAEPIHFETLSRFADKFAACGFRPEAFYPCYGLAEATLLVSGVEINAKPSTISVSQEKLGQGVIQEAAGGSENSKTLVGCGRPLSGQSVQIVNPDTLEPCKTGETGEIWVSSPSVAAGYWQNEEASRESFGAVMAGGSQESFLRTGDIGFLHENELYVAGRLKDLIVIRGANYYPHDIERHTEESLSQIAKGPSAAFSVEDKQTGEEQLVIIKELDRQNVRKAAFDEIFTLIRSGVTEAFELQAHAIVLVGPRGIPFTSSGKVQRNLCRQRFLSSELEIISQWSIKSGRAKTSEQNQEPGELHAGENRAVGVLDLAKPDKVNKTKEEIEQWLVTHLSVELGLPFSEIDIEAPFVHFGLDSIKATRLAAEFGAWMGREFSPVITYDYPNIKTLAKYISGEYRTSQRADKMKPRTEPIAIVGIGCRYPGAPDKEAFWQMLKEGVDAVTEAPAERGFVDNQFGLKYFGGYLQEIDQFDAGFFEINEREAINMDPQQRIMLEICWEAIEDAGINLEHLKGSKTGVFVGVSSMDYSHHMLSNPDYTDPFAGPGNAASINANRISYLFDLRGPSLAVDTACSSSLVAAHLALKSLRSGECDMAFVGGINILLTPTITNNFHIAGFMAPDGRCKSFDDAADGYVRSEGAGVLILKPLSQAQADGDHIYSIIQGSAINQDGRTNGMTAPNTLAQMEVLKQAYAEAGIDPAEVQYVEAHGTGTKLGDPIETNALGEVFGSDRDEANPCLIGSVKSNIGHLEPASGVAGVVKAALALERKLIPPSLHFNTPNSYIDFDQLKLQVQTKLGPWPQSSCPARAGVNSFGFGGTNAHLILEEAPASSWMQLEPVSQIEPGLQEESYILPVSARSNEALQGAAQKLATFLDDLPEDVEFATVCYNASLRRTHHPSRTALVAKTKEEMTGLLKDFANRTEPETLLSLENRKPVFVYSGQGTQWRQMGQLFQNEEVYQAKLRRCDELLKAYAPWSLLEELSVEPEKSRLHHTRFAQVAIFAVQAAMTDLWRSWGIESEAVVGHSVGEVAAAYAAGVLTLEEALHVVYERGRLMEQANEIGRMVAVGLSADEIRGQIAGYNGALSIGAINGPHSTVVSGETEAIHDLAAKLAQKDIFTQMLDVNYAFHSPQMEESRIAIEKELKNVTPKSANKLIFSTVTGAQAQGEEFDAAYWGRNVREAVSFYPAVDACLEQGYRHFVEVGPSAALIGMVRQCMDERGVQGVVIGSAKRDDTTRYHMLKGLSTLYAAGQSVHWEGVYPKRRRHLSLPSYPWQRKRHWIEHDQTGSRRRRFAASDAGANRHPHLDYQNNLPDNPQTGIWNVFLDLNDAPFLKDHQVQGLTVFPAAGYGDIATAAGTGLFGAEGLFSVENMEFKQILILNEENDLDIQLVVSKKNEESYSFKFFSKQSSASDAPWSLHATGSLVKAQEAAVQEFVFDEIKERCSEPLSCEDYYKLMKERGLEYGTAFQGIDELYSGKGDAFAKIAFPSSPGSKRSYSIHPAVLDACFQLMGATLTKQGDDVKDDAYLPVSWKSLKVHQEIKPDEELWAYVQLDEELFSQDRERLIGNIYLLNGEGALLAEVESLCLQVLAGFGDQKDISKWLYSVDWQPKKLKLKEAALSKEGAWLIFGGSKESTQALLDHFHQAEKECILVAPGKKFEKTASTYYKLNPALPSDFKELFEDLFQEGALPCAGIVYMWGLESAPASTLQEIEAVQERGAYGAMHLIQALGGADTKEPPRLYLVTSNAIAPGSDESDVSFASSPLLGLAKAVAHEHRELGCTTVDLQNPGDLLQTEALFNEVISNELEDQVVLRENGRYVARMKRLQTDELKTDGAQEANKPALLSTSSFQLEINKTGVLDNLFLREKGRREPGPGEVEIQVKAAGLNFRDVMKSMGLYPGESGEPWFGDECSGVITALGKGVKKFKTGDHVIAVAAQSMASHVTTSELFVVHKPEGFDFNEAATFPIAFLTAYYCLFHLGRMIKGERVLVHAAAGGVGLAAIQLAQHVGAEVYATAGSPKKREYLKSLGVRHIFNSRTLDFADEISEATSGEGVDIVLNSLAGEAISKSMELLRPYGRFLEIGKRDIYENSQLDLYPFHNNLSFAAVDMEQVFRQRPEFSGELLQSLMSLHEKSAIRPLPLKTFPVNEAPAAFKFMAEAKHTGKIVISLEEQEVSVAPERHHGVQQDKTYLVTGGLGALGLKLAEWLQDQGARHICLVGRSAPSDEAKAVMQELKEKGATVTALQTDVADLSKLKSCLEKIEKSKAPLGGVIHAAAVFDDALLSGYDADRFQKVMAPKAFGAWNLHVLTRELPLDFFILFSSVASVFGSAGQGAYCAANAFLDSLAHYRARQGQRALSINWGPWAEVGAAVQNGESATFRGIENMAVQKALEAMAKVMDSSLNQVTIVPIDLQALKQHHPMAAESPLLEKLFARETLGKGQTSAVRLAMLDLESPEERIQYLETHLMEQVSGVLKVSVTTFNRETPFASLGFESLMAFEFRNRLEQSLGISLPVTLLWGNYSNIAELAEHLAEKMNLTGEDEDMAPLASTEIEENTDEELNLYSEEDVDELLELI